MDKVKNSQNKKFDEEAFLDSLSPIELREFARVGVRYTACFVTEAISRMINKLKSPKDC